MPGEAAASPAAPDEVEAERRRVLSHLEPSLLRRLPLAMAVAGRAGDILLWNDRAAQLTGRPAEEVLGRLLGDLQLGTDVAGSPERRRQLREVGRWTGPLDLRRPAGDHVTVLLTIERLREPACGFEGWLATAEDLTEQRRLQARLEHQAQHDPLTGLANRRRLVEHLDAALERAGSSRLAVLFIDLDDFKPLNDRLGHEGGDEALRAVADLLGAAVRPGDLVARMGGDEFVVCCEGVADADTALHLAARILRILRVPFRVRGTRASLSATIGIALSGGGVTTGEELLRNADAAMYRAKGEGKHHARVFDVGLHEQRRRRRDVATALAGALDAGRIVAHHQPIVEPGTGRLRGFEALARWVDPAEGLLGPDRFITVAEETGQVERLGLQVLHQALAALATWDAQAPGRELTVSVNVSAQQLQAPGFVAAVGDALGDAGIGPGRLCVELTESALADDRVVTGTLRRLRQRGVRVALDDFGTGYSSLTRLRHLPLDALKVDRAFVEQIDEDPSSRLIVAAVTSLAEGLGLEVVAEGVERPAQALAVRDLGCTLAQGFLWSPPLDDAGAAAVVERGGLGAPG